MSLPVCLKYVGGAASVIL